MPPAPRRGLLEIIADGLDDAAGLAETVTGSGDSKFVQALRSRARRARKAREHLTGLQDRVAEGSQILKGTEQPRKPGSRRSDVEVKSTPKESA
jgi:hypothetical protein